jgi:hypothetical protein
MQTLRSRTGQKKFKLTKQERRAFDLVRELSSDIAATAQEPNLKESASFVVHNIEHVLGAVSPVVADDPQGALPLSDEPPVN